MSEYEYKVRNFTYNGFGGMLQPGDAPYTVSLIRWTLDPGVGLFQCSDGKERLIPTFAVIGHPEWKRPADAPADYDPIGYIGQAARS